MKNPRAVWPVVKFLIAVSGFGKKEARELLDQVPVECYGDLFVRAREWDAESDSRAGKLFAEITRGKEIRMLTEATKRARFPSTADIDGEDETPRRRARKTKK